jgi:hypothetical protein
MRTGGVEIQMHNISSLDFALLYYEAARPYKVMLGVGKLPLVESCSQERQSTSNESAK